MTHRYCGLAEIDVAAQTRWRHARSHNPEHESQFLDQKRKKALTWHDSIVYCWNSCPIATTFQDQFGID